MTKALSDFYDHLLPQLPGCTPEFLDVELRQVLRKYTTVSRCWHDTLVPLQPDGTRTVFALQPQTARVELAGLVAMMHGTELYWRVREHAPLPQWVTVQSEQIPLYPDGEPPFALSDELGYVTLDRAPTSQVVFTGWVRPAYNLTAFPDFLFTRHLEAIQAGVFSRMKRMTGKPWFDPGWSEWRNDWNAAVNRAAVRADRQNTTGPLRTRKSPF